jgi:hypothetical protein
MTDPEKVGFAKLTLGSRSWPTSATALTAYEGQPG